MRRATFTPFVVSVDGVMGKEVWGVAWRGASRYVRLRVSCTDVCTHITICIFTQSNQAWGHREACLDWYRTQTSRNAG